MPVSVPLEFRAVRMELVSGGALVASLLHPRVVRVDGSEEELRRAFAQALEKHCIHERSFLEAFQCAPLPELRRDKILVKTGGDDTPGLPPILDFDILYSELPCGDFIGFVPVLGVEAAGPDEGRLRKSLAESVQLELLRKKRLKSLRSLVPVMWFRSMRAVALPFRLECHSPRELEEMEAQRNRSLLEEATDELTASGPCAFGLEEELDQLARSFKGPYRQSTLLTGPPGSGKSALVEELCARKDDLGLEDLDLRRTTAARLVAKLTGEGGWQANLDRLCKEIEERDEVLYVGSLRQLFEVGRYHGNEISMAEHLKDALARGRIVLLSECTEEEAARMDVTAPGYTALFRRIRLKEPPPERMEAIIEQRAALAASRRRVKMERESVLEAIRLHRRFTPYSGFPGKPVRFLDAAVSGPAGGGRVIDKREVVRLFCEETGLPRFMVDSETPMDTRKVRELFASRIFGQEAAVEIIVDLLASVKTSLTRQGKPMASLFFAGPTGVGKTETAKVLAEFIFSSPDRMVRLDMSEFSDPVSVLRLVGEGRGGDGILTSAVRKQPFCVLLLDEMEKAHDTFHDLLLQVLGEGRLTDAAGRVADFCSAIVVMTSNIGSETYQSSGIGFAEGTDEVKQAREHFGKAVQEHFRPELVNRLDRIVAFAPLDLRTVRRVLRRELDKVEAREGIRQRNLSLSVDEEVMERLAIRGHDPRYGARPLQRTLRDELLAPLSRKLNRHDFQTPLEASVKLVEDRPEIVVKRATEGRREPGETESEELFARLADALTRGRREMRRILDGPVFVDFQSEVAILGRMQKKRKEAFWSDAETASRYTSGLALENRFKEAMETVESLEVQGGLALLGLQELGPELYHRLRQWKEALKEMKVRLHSTVEPGDDVCCLGIYGGEERLRELVEIYFGLARARGFQASCRTVVLKDEEFLTLPWDPQRPGGADDARPLGAEMEFRGPCAFPYLQDEEGKVEWEGEKTLPYRILVAKGGFDGWTTPPNVHRSSFFTEPEHKVRRTYARRYLRDKPYGVEDVRCDDFAGLLAELLDKRLESKLTRFLKEGDGGKP